MTFTDYGTRVKWEWCPQALANGIEWANNRRGMRDVWSNLYRFRAAKLCWFLHLIGAIMGRFYRPFWCEKKPIARLKQESQPLNRRFGE